MTKGAATGALWSPGSTVPHGMIRPVLASVDAMVRAKEMLKEEPSGFLKYDGDKMRLHLVPVEAIVAIGEVLEYGARKYGEQNWRKGTDWTRYYDACLRHLYAWIGGEDNDNESGLPHLAHALCCLSFLLTASKLGYGTDDRLRGIPDGKEESKCSSGDCRCGGC